jgi:hypothetical protein
VSSCSHGMNAGLCVVPGCPNQENPRHRYSSPKEPNKTHKCRCGRRVPKGTKCDHERDVAMAAGGRKSRWKYMRELQALEGK